MGKLSELLPSYEPGTRGLHGKPAACDIYGLGDIDDWRAVQGIVARRGDGGGWTKAQVKVDEALGVTRPISYHQFVHHWHRKCGHWTDAQRAEDL